MLDRSVAQLASIVYFIQGALGIVAIALPLYLKQVGFSISEIAYITSVGSFPWFFKIIYGALSDSVPFLGYRRKTYIFISSLFSLIGWVFLSLGPQSYMLILGALLIVNIGFAATDVITDGLIVEKSDKNTVSKYQSLSWGFRSLGAVLSGVVGGYLAYQFSYRYVFLFASILPLVTLIYSFFVHEEKVTVREGIIWEPIWRSLLFFKTKPFLLFSLLLIILACTACFSTPYFFYLKETVQLTEQQLGLLSSVTWVGAILGAFIFGKFLSVINLGRVIFAGIILNLIGILSCFLVKDFVSAMVIFSINGVLGYLILLPLLSFAAKLSHATTVEGCLFAVLMSVHNFGTLFSSMLGGYLFQWTGLNNLILLSALLGIIAIPVLMLLNKSIQFGVMEKG